MADSKCNDVVFLALNLHPKHTSTEFGDEPLVGSNRPMKTISPSPLRNRGSKYWRYTTISGIFYASFVSVGLPGIAHFTRTVHPEAVQ